MVGSVEWMFGSRTCEVSDRVIDTAEMSSLIAFRFWMSLARSGAPASQAETPNPRARINPQRSSVIEGLRSDGDHISYYE